MQPSTLTLAILAALAATALPGMAEEPQAKADVGFVAKADKLPNAVVMNVGDVNRLKPLIEALPEGHRLRLEFTTVPKSITGQPNDIRYAHLVTTVDAKDQPDGLEVEYGNWYQHPVRKSLYKQGVKDGVEQLFHAGTDKLQHEIPWVSGKIEGVKKSYHQNGTPSVETPYKAGKITGEVKSFTDKSGLLRVARFTAGVRDGEMVDYWPDRQNAVERSVPYRKGQIHGMSRAFYADGKPKWEKPFRDNLQHGVEKQFSPDGKLERERHWIDGDTVTPEEFKAKYKP
jgi:antitoxin component YwqK of YwqJK toxin-antitoxin module